MNLYEKEEHFFHMIALKSNEDIENWINIKLIV